MPYVCPRITDGLGNRFFQVAAALGYAEKYGHIPVFADQWIIASNHSGSKPIQAYFPELQTIHLMPGWTCMEEPPNGAYTYFALPRTDLNINLKGYFQSERYFPSGGIKRPELLVGLEKRYENYAFLHVRRGDYLLDVCKHHNVNLKNYYRYALALFSDSDTKILVCSDDIEWCKTNFLYSDLIDKTRMEFYEGNDLETLQAMTACARGGITANSTFSWWGAYWNVGRGKGGIYTMPSKWGNPPLPEVKDLFPSWAYLLPV